jgi:hypothetical protein
MLYEYIVVQDWTKMIVLVMQNSVFHLILNILIVFEDPFRNVTFFDNWSNPVNLWDQLDSTSCLKSENCSKWLRSVDQSRVEQLQFEQLIATH